MPPLERTGTELVLAGILLFVTSTALLTYTGQTVHAFSAALGNPSLIRPVVEVIQGNESFHDRRIARLAFWPLVLNLLTGILSVASMIATPFFRECGKSRQRVHVFHRAKGFYISNLTLIANALLATVAFLSTTIIHARSQARRNQGDGMYGQHDQGSGVPPADVESWGCVVLAPSSDDVCGNGKPMRIMLIPHFIAAWLIVLCVARFLRAREPDDATDEDTDDEDGDRESK